MRELTPTELVKRRGVRRMKLIAAGFLVGATILYAISRWQESRGAGWAGYVSAAAEAGMVGGLADWFAVTALFRRPLGLPIPHTAIIPKRKDDLGASLGDFVGENFLSAAVIRRRLQTLDITARLGKWLADPEHAQRVAAELSQALRGASTVLRDEDVHAIIRQAVTRRLEAQKIGPPLGGLLGRFVEDGGHRPLVDVMMRRAHEWVSTHQETIERTVSGEAPAWSPRFIDERIAHRVHRELVKLTADVRDDPEHPFRGIIDGFLADFAMDLRTDPDTMARAEVLKARVINHPEVQNLVASGWAAARGSLLESAADPDSELRRRAVEAITSFGLRLAGDDRLRTKVDRWTEGAAVHIVTTYRAEITALITDTIGVWDAAETSRKIEIQVGRDLQFIRLNGTVVGALAGLLIYTVAKFWW